jgi:hypothetical protein
MERMVEEEGKGKKEEMQAGDRILMTALHPLEAQIAAATTISQQLAEAAAKGNMTQKKDF